MILKNRNNNWKCKRHRSTTHWPYYSIHNRNKFVQNQGNCTIIIINTKRCFHLQFLHNMFLACNQCIRFLMTSAEILHDFMKSTTTQKTETFVLWLYHTTMIIFFKIHSHCTFEAPEKLDLLLSHDVACLARL